MGRLGQQIIYQINALIHFSYQVCTLMWFGMQYAFTLSEAKKEFELHICISQILKICVLGEIYFPKATMTLVWRMILIKITEPQKWTVIRVHLK